jgi:Domain of unknown function (DUF3291)
MHLAELNIAKPRFPLDDPRMADFVNNLDRVNAVAERSPGFVWRLKGDGNDATDIRFDDDPDSIVNMSVWETAEHLEHFVWNTVHKHIYRRRDEWFPSFGKPYFVCGMCRSATSRHWRRPRHGSTTSRRTARTAISSAGKGFPI